ncbi:MAG: hypothetical protein AB7K37_11255 [Cyclobacteriaceae bacterium]
MNPLDELFGKKLSAHQVQPSADAWSRIEKNIAKKNSGWVTWLRAASIVFLLGVGFVAWRIIGTQDANQPPQMATATETKETKEPVKTDHVANSAEQDASKPVDDLKAESKPAATTTVHDKTSRTPVEKPMITQGQTKEVTKQVDQQLVYTNESIAQLNEEPAAVATPATEIERITADKAMVVVYTLELPTQLEETMPEATAAGESGKKTGLKRVLELARDARSTENPIGELRQAKNELLAFNFGRDREQRNDK